MKHPNVKSLTVAMAALCGAMLAAGAACAQHVIADVGFEGPEAARYDAAGDRLIVSNLGERGAPNDGFISLVSPDGEVLELKWIAGGDGVELYDPLGVFIKGDTLYVADTDAVRLFDRVSGEPRGAIPVEGAVRLNDLVVADDGTIYVTDSGTAEDDGALYRISPDRQVHVFAARSPDLHRPNGVALTADGLVVHGGLLASNLVFRTPQGEVVRELALPTGRIDGIVALDDGSLLVASQDGGNVYHVSAAGEATEVAGGIAVPAAIGFDTRRNRLVVPQISAASLTLFDLFQDE